MPHAPARYHRAAMALHWLLAGLLTLQFGLGLRLDRIAGLADRFNAYQLHKSLGIAILLFSLIRLVLRYAVPRPPAADGGPRGLAAKLVHGLFYVVMIGAPLSGWAVVSLARIKLPTVLFGVVPWPHLPLPPALLESAELGHSVLAWCLPGLIVLHLAGVAWHWRQNDGVVLRMAPAALGPGALLAGGAALLALPLLAGLTLTAPDWWRGLSARPAPAAGAPAGTGGPAGAVASSPAATAGPETPASLASPSADPAAETAQPAALASAASSGSDWSVLRGSRLGFSTSYGGTAINGSFGDWRAEIRFDPAHPDQARISAVIMLGSARSGDAERDETLKGPSFFNIANQPRARFAASGFQPAGKDRYTATGTLTLDGVSRPVRLTFALTITGNRARASGTASLSRLAYRVGRDEWEATDQIPDRVGISFTIDAVRR